MSLKQQLDEINRQAGEVLPQPVLDKFTKLSEHMKVLDIESKAAKVGERAPLFSLPKVGEGECALAETLTNGPATVLFFRGRW